MCILRDDLPKVIGKCSGYIEDLQMTKEKFSSLGNSYFCKKTGIWKRELSIILKVNHENELGKCPSFKILISTLGLF